MTRETIIGGMRNGEGLSPATPTARGANAVTKTTAANCSRIPIRMLTSFPRMRIPIHQCSTPCACVHFLEYRSRLDGSQQRVLAWERSIQRARCISLAIGKEDCSLPGAIVSLAGVESRLSLSLLGD
jgi:hypothetical protein